MGMCELQDFARICDDVVIIRFVILNTTSRKYQTEKHVPYLKRGPVPSKATDLVLKVEEAGRVLDQ